jgi:hypothetical protein
MSPTAPLRKVVKSNLREGPCIISDFTERWWDLTLECGHITERRVRFPKQKGRQRRGFAIMHHPRKASEALPPPTRCRCKDCARAGDTGLIFP